MHSRPVILRVAINTPVRKLFDYLPPANCDPEKLVPGLRLRVPFGKSREKTGLLLGIENSSALDLSRLKRVSAILDDQPLLDQKLLDFMQWAAAYYQHPCGEAILGNLPKLLSNGSPLKEKGTSCWRLTPAGIASHDTGLEKAPRQHELLKFMRTFPDGVDQETIRNNFDNWRGPLNKLLEKGLMESFTREPPQKKNNKNHTAKSIDLNKEQIQARDTILSALDRYRAFLLNGVTGSGKTEVYINVIETIIAQGSQALVLVPEIGLTPQFIERFRHRLDTQIAVLHSGLSDRERLASWLDARQGRAQVVIGTRSAIWTPFRRLGIIVVDEEHDLSYKQQEGFRYSARDLAVIRARQENIPVVLGSATPSLESIFNAASNRYQEIKLNQRTGSAGMPAINILDIRGSKMTGALSSTLLGTIRHYLDNRQQVLLFLNRRGYAPVMMCHDCGWTSKCPRCTIQMTYHKNIARFCCHHCGHQEKAVTACAECGGNKIIEVGHGTQRIVETVESFFPDAKILRIDRDSTRRKGSMQAMLDEIHNGRVDILIGTQMLAKGHHFPKVTLVGIIDADQGLYSADYRGSERLAQIITQVSGRAGRADSPGRVVLQTHHPEHPLLQALARHDYAGATALIMEEREQTRLPPYSYQVLLRADANDQYRLNGFLHDAKNALSRRLADIGVYGPLIAPIEKRAGRFRMQLLLQSDNRKVFRNIVADWVGELEKLPDARKVRWSLDVDPQDML